MNWKRWKQGLVVSSLTGLLTGLAAWATLTAQIDLIDFLKLLTLNIASQALMYLKSHPAEGMPSGDTAIITKTPPPT